MLATERMGGRPVDLLGTYTPIGALIAFILLVGTLIVRGVLIPRSTHKLIVETKDELIAVQTTRGDSWEAAATRKDQQLAAALPQLEIVGKFFSEVGVVPSTGDNIDDSRAGAD